MKKILFNTCIVILSYGLFFCSTVGAQPAMPSVEEMAGIPRVDNALPKGTLIVRAVEKELASPLSNASITIYRIGDPFESQKDTDSQGRVTFEQLSAGYYIASLQTPTGEIFSRVLSMDGNTSYRLLLSSSSIPTTTKLQTLRLTIQSTLPSKEVPPIDIALSLISNADRLMISSRSFSTNSPVLTYQHLPLNNEGEFYVLRSIHPDFWVDIGAIKLSNEKDSIQQQSALLYKTTQDMTSLVIAPSIEETPRILIYSREQELFIEETFPIKNLGQTFVALKGGVTFTLPNNATIFYLKSSYSNLLWSVESKESNQLVYLEGIIPPQSNHWVTIHYKLNWQQAHAAIQQSIVLPIEKLSVAMEDSPTIRLEITPKPSSQARVEQKPIWNVFVLDSVPAHTPFQLSFTAKDPLLQSKYFKWIGLGGGLMILFVVLLWTVVSPKRKNDARQYRELLQKKANLLKQLSQLPEESKETAHTIEEDLVKIYESIDRMERFFIR